MAKTPTPAPEQPAEQDPPAGGRWVDAREADDAAAEKWGKA